MIIYGISLFFVINLYRHANFQYYIDWKYDASTKQMLKDLSADVGPNPTHKVTMGIVWLHEPAINFYRKAWKLDWLQEVTRDGYNGSYDYYYVTDVDSIIKKDIFKDKTIIKEYPLSNTVLLK